MPDDDQQSEADVVRPKTTPFWPDSLIHRWAGTQSSGFS